MARNLSFGYWVRRLRKALDLTQAELGRMVGASAATIRKIEADERRPSRELAELLADRLAVAPEERRDFILAARGVLTTQGLHPVPGQLFVPASTPPHNLPAPMTSMVNRKNDLAAVTALLLHDDVRLLTLLGPPGMGKTRLSIQAGESILSHFIDGVWFVDLATIMDAELLAPTIALALGSAVSPGQSPIDQLKDELKAKKMLLVLDNFEQLAEEGTRDLIGLLRACKGLKLLVTSRVRLNVYGEFEYPLPPMTLPPLIDRYAPSELLEYESVQLFVARTRQHRPGFTLTAETAAPVAQICRRMDGLPLALELAAARTRHMEIRELAAALREASGRDWHALLHTSARDLPPRQQTLFNAIAWSYSLLSPQEQVVFARLGVFAGVFDAPAVTAVCSDLVDNEPLLMALIERLVDQNLVSLDARAPDRWRLLEMIREFALTQMDEQEIRTAKHHHMHHFATRHAEWYADWLDPAYLDAIEEDLDNYRAAIRYVFEAADSCLAHLLGASMGRFWERRGLLNEGRAVLAEILALRGEVDPKARFAVMHEACILAWMQHDFETAESLTAEAMVLARTQQSTEAILVVLNLLGRIYLEQARYDEADRVLSEAIDLGRNLEPPWPTTMQLIQMGESALARGDLERAEALTRTGLDTVSVNELIPYCLGWSNLAEVRLGRGEPKIAVDALRRVLPLAHLHSRRTRIFLNAVAGAILATQPISDRRLAVATGMLAYVTMANQRLGDPLSPMTQRLLAERMVVARLRMMADHWQKAWDEGMRWTQTDALAIAAEMLGEQANSS